MQKSTNKWPLETLVPVSKVLTASATEDKMKQGLISATLIGELDIH